MGKVTIVTKILNIFLMLALLAAVLGFLSFANAYGIFLAAVTTIILVGVWQHKRWGYFASAAWALACYQLAKQGYEFEDIKHWVMLAGFMVIAVAIYLHEKLGKKSEHNESNGSDHG